jgi:5'-nucleotidase
VQVPIEIAQEQSGPFTGSIDVGPGKVSAGKKLSVAGHGFEPGETLAAQLRGKKGVAIDLGTIRVGDHGRFAASLAVPASTQPGAYTLAVAQADGDEATATVHVNRSDWKPSVVERLLDALWQLLCRIFG